MGSLKKQLVWVFVGTAIATLLFGLGLSFLINRGLEQLEDQPDILLPGSSSPQTVP